MSGGMHLPRQSCYQTTFCSTKAPGTPRLCQRMMWHGTCHEAEIWERDVCSGSKKQQPQPREETNGTQKRSVLTQHSP